MTDQSEPEPAYDRYAINRVTNDRAEIAILGYDGDKPMYYWKVVARNGEVLLTSFPEWFTRARDAKRNFFRCSEALHGMGPFLKNRPEAREAAIL